MKGKILTIYSLWATGTPIDPPWGIYATYPVSKNSIQGVLKKSYSQKSGQLMILGQMSVAILSKLDKYLKYIRKKLNFE